VRASGLAGAEGLAHTPRAMPTPSAPLITEAAFAAAASGSLSLPPAVQLEVAFAGRSNVGKSTLLNGLMRRKALARTSNTPGCTRTINFFDVKTQDGLELKLVDLPGYGYAKRAKAEREGWADLIEEYLLERSTLKLVVILVDARRGMEDEEHDLLTLMNSPSQSGRPRRPAESRNLRGDLDAHPQADRGLGSVVVGLRGRVSRRAWIQPWVLARADLDPRARRGSQQTDRTGAACWKNTRKAKRLAQVLRKTESRRGPRSGPSNEQKTFGRRAQRGGQRLCASLGVSSRWQSP